MISSHPTLDDPFFSIHEFNRETEELEALQVTSGKLGKDDDEDDDFDDEMDDDDLLGNLGSGKGVDMWRSVEGDGQGGTDGARPVSSVSRCNSSDHRIFPRLLSL